MKLLRTLAWIAGMAILVLLLIRAGLIAVMAPYALYVGLRESGYPWWIQVPAVMALIAGIGYLWRSGALERLGWRR